MVKKMAKRMAKRMERKKMVKKATRKRRRMKISILSQSNMSYTSIYHTSLQAFRKDPNDHFLEGLQHVLTVRPDTISTRVSRSE